MTEAAGSCLRGLSAVCTKITIKCFVHVAVYQAWKSVHIVLNAHSAPQVGISDLP